jgi:hypothetical protein
MGRDGGKGLAHFDSSIIFLGSSPDYLQEYQNKPYLLSEIRTLDFFIGTI